MKGLSILSSFISGEFFVESISVYFSVFKISLKERRHGRAMVSV